MSRRTFLIINIIISLAAGLLIYLLLDRNLIAFRALGISASGGVTSIAVTGFIRSYLPDMLWAYALTFGVNACLGENAGLRMTCITAIVFSALIESLQLSTHAAGTFDMWDIAAEIIAVLIAAYILKRFTGGKNT